MAKDESEIPNNMRKVYRLLKRWRNLHTGRSPIPEPLWEAVAEVAQEQGDAPRESPALGVWEAEGVGKSGGPGGERSPRKRTAKNRREEMISRHPRRLN